MPAFHVNPCGESSGGEVNKDVMMQFLMNCKML
jgi:hypothetical protein